MILQCSACKARYLVPDSSIGADGRHVRCAKCGHTWFQAQTSEDSATFSDLDKLLDEINARPKGLPKGSLPALRGQATLGMKVAVILMSVAAIGMLLLATVPGLLGLPRSTGVVLANIGVVKLSDDQHNSFQINGKIANNTGVIKTVPNLRVTLVDDDGTSLQYWDFPGEGKVLGPWNAIAFSTGNLDIRFSRGSRFVVELGNPMELALRRKPPVATSAPAAEPTATPTAEHTS